MHPCHLCTPTSKYCRYAMGLCTGLEEQTDDLLSICNKMMCKRKRPKQTCCPKHRKTSGFHKKCIPFPYPGCKNVPSCMGWLWNLDSKRVKQGWRPGAISNRVRKTMRFFLKDFPVDNVPVSQFHSHKDSTNLHICKKNGETYITWHKPEDPHCMQVCGEPCRKATIQFKITKKKKDTTCCRPVVRCCCNRCRLECDNDNSSDAEYDVVITPPVDGLVSEIMKDRVCQCTQYTELDWKRQCKGQGQVGKNGAGDAFEKERVSRRRSPGAYSRRAMHSNDRSKHGADKVENQRVSQKSSTTAYSRKTMDSNDTPKNGFGKFENQRVSQRSSPAARRRMMDSNGTPQNEAGTKVAAGGHSGISKKEKKRQMLGLMPPPILCQIERRGKPTPCCYSFLGNNCC